MHWMKKRVQASPYTSLLILLDWCLNIFPLVSRFFPLTQVPSRDEKDMPSTTCQAFLHRSNMFRAKVSAPCGG